MERYKISSTITVITPLPPKKKKLLGMLTPMNIHCKLAKSWFNITIHDEGLYYSRKISGP